MKKLLKYRLWKIVRDLHVNRDSDAYEQILEARENGNRVNITHMTADEMRKAILGPDKSN